MKSLLTWTERSLLWLFRMLSNRQNFHLKAEMYSFHSKYFVYRELKRAPQKLSFCFKCPDTGTVRILGNILYSLFAFGQVSDFKSYLHCSKRNTSRERWAVNRSPYFFQGFFCLTNTVCKRLKTFTKITCLFCSLFVAVWLPDILATFFIYKWSSGVKRN